jgi:hypothetical protein
VSFISFGEIRVTDSRLCAEIRTAAKGKSPQAAALALRLRAKSLAVPTLEERLLKLLKLSGGTRLQEERCYIQGALQYFGRYLRFYPTPIQGI